MAKATWLTHGTNRYGVLCADSREAVWPDWDFDCVVFDPEWDEPWHLWLPTAPTTLVFTGPRFVGKTVQAFGDPTNVLTWDGQGVVYRGPHRPLSRTKFCFHYGPTYRYKHTLYWRTPEQLLARYGKNWKTSMPDYERTGLFLQDLWQEPLSKQKALHGHAHAKPLDWLRLLIGNTSDRAVYDPFAGSGNALLAALALGRDAFGVERDAALCDQIIMRLVAAGCEYA